MPPVATQPLAAVPGSTYFHPVGDSSLYAHICQLFPFISEPPVQYLVHVGHVDPAGSVVVELSGAVQVMSGLFSEHASVVPPFEPTQFHLY